MLKDRTLEAVGSKLGQILLFCGRILFREGGVFVRFSDSAIIMEFVRFTDSAIIIYSSFQQLLFVMAEKNFYWCHFVRQSMLFFGRVLFREGVFVRFSDSSIIMEFVRFSDSDIIIYSSFQQLLIVMAEKTFIDAILSVVNLNVIWVLLLAPTTVLGIDRHEVTKDIVSSCHDVNGYSICEVWFKDLGSQCENV